MIGRRQRVGAIALTCICLGGCLVSTSQQINETGATIAPQTLQQIEVGRTTEAWLVATLGQPTSRVQVDGSDELHLLRYTSTVEKTGQTAIFVLFAGSKTAKTSRTHYFEVSRGVVVRHWSDS
jgi:hypothetical protein